MGVMLDSLRFAPLWDELAAFLLAGACAGCDTGGTLLCGRCRGELRGEVLRRVTPGGVEVVAALPYAGVPARCIRRLKEDGETHLARPLGTALAAALDDAARSPAGVRFVPMPTSPSAFRRRGYRVPELLTRRAGIPPARILRTAKAIADQRGLGVSARAQNVAGSMYARGRGDDTPVVIIDDVITTGATIDEGARALRAAGFRVLSAVALAATPRHLRPVSDTSGREGDIR